jgi:hypothetical protein
MTSTSPKAPNVLTLTSGPSPAEDSCSQTLFPKTDSPPRSTCVPSGTVTVTSPNSRLTCTLRSPAGTCSSVSPKTARASGPASTTAPSTAAGTSNPLARLSTCDR